MPKLVVTKDARPYVEDVYFNEDAYTHYLLEDRKQPEEAVEKLSLELTTQHIRSQAIAHYSPPLIEKGEHVIRFSALRTPRNAKRQGDMLRHETEHFIQAATGNMMLEAAGRVAIVVGASAAGGIGLGNESYTSAHQALEQLPEALAVGGSIAAAGIAGAAGFTALGYTANEFSRFFSPYEFGARRAEKKQALALPNGTLNIFFKRRA